MKLRSPLALLALAGALILPSIAYAADTTGDEGRVKSIELLSPSAAAYVQYHGRITITANKRNVEYRWGGTSCGSKTLSADLIDQLVVATRHKDTVKLTPTYATGAGSSKCLVGFSIRHKAKASSAAG